MQLTYNNRSVFGDGCLEPGNAGLSKAGIAAVNEDERNRRRGRSQSQRLSHYFRRNRHFHEASADFPFRLCRSLSASA